MVFLLSLKARLVEVELLLRKPHCGDLTKSFFDLNADCAASELLRATRVVPLPQKGSSTLDVAFENEERIFETAPSGF